MIVPTLPVPVEPDAEVELLIHLALPRLHHRVEGGEAAVDPRDQLGDPPRRHHVAPHQRVDALVLHGEGLVQNAPDPRYDGERSVDYLGPDADFERLLANHIAAHTHGLACTTNEDDDDDDGDDENPHTDDCGCGCTAG